MGHLSHWGRMTHVCISKLTINGSDNGLSPSWHQAIIWTNAETLLIGPLETNVSEILIKIYIFSLNKNALRMSSGNWKSPCFSLNVLVLHEISCCTEAIYNNIFFVIIEIKLKSHFHVYPLLPMISLHILAHASKTHVSCDAHNLYWLLLSEFGWEQNEISLTFELWQKNG